MNDCTPEELLSGGNVNEVRRVGETVRRTPSGNLLVRPLLETLQENDFLGAPAFLGVDEAGREVFSYIPGYVAGNDYPDNPPELWSDQALMGIGRLLRCYHDASQSLAARLPVQPSRYLENWQNEVICHNDAALYNVVFQQGEPVAFIDFDMAAPGPRVWDIAYTLYTCVPLAGFQPLPGRSATTKYDAQQHLQDRRRRVALFFQAYGMEAPADIGFIICQRIQALCTTLRERADAGEAAFIKMIEEGHLTHYEEELTFLNEHIHQWL